MNHKIEAVNKTEYQELVNVWEASVRATTSLFKRKRHKVF